ncbi:hypothetical protein ACWCV9_03185 [Streptomyces sp. NPDC001606]
MRAIRLASAALLGLGALAVCAPAVLAGDDHDVTPFGFRITPTTVAAGETVSLRFDRDGSGCRGTATVSSGIFDTVRIPPGRSSATAVVDRGARPATAYSVTFECDGTRGSTDLTIGGGRDDGYQRPGQSEPVDPVDPVQRGVRAGTGGSIDGFAPGRIALGAALITGSAAAAYHFTHRRSAGNGG